MATARTRSTYLDEPKGYRGRFGATDGGFNVAKETATATDFTGAGDCHPFNVWKTSVEGGYIDKPYTGFFSSWFDHYRADWLDNLSIFQHIEYLGGSEFPNDVDLATQAAARTNPSRPYVDVAANVLEMGDVTKKIRKSGRDIIEKIVRYAAYRNRHGFKKAVKAFGDINLQYNFGIAPLVGDIVKLCDFATAFDRRCKEIVRLRQARGFRKTIDFGRWTKSLTYNEVFQSQDAFVVAPVTVRTDEAARVHVRWITDEDPSHLMPEADMLKLIRSSMNNISITQTALWEAVPWSWLIDWATNVGTYFKATQNQIPAYLDGVHVMRHSRTEWSWSQQTDSGSDWVLSPGRATYETKSRKPSFVFPTAHFPFLSGKQMGILASLAVTRT